MTRKNKKDEAGVIHAANIEKSRRLRLTLGPLQAPVGWTTKEIHQLTGSMAVHTDIAELRANGYDIECKCIARGRFEYRLAGGPK